MAAVKLDKAAPKPFCCLTNFHEPKSGIVGNLYQAETGPINIVDSKTLLLKNFKVEAHKAPGKKNQIFLEILNFRCLDFCGKGNCSTFNRSKSLCSWKRYS